MEEARELTNGRVDLDEVARTMEEVETNQEVEPEGETAVEPEGEVEETPEEETSEEGEDVKEQPKNIPYSRFQEVNTKKNELQEELKKMREQNDYLLRETRIVQKLKEFSEENEEFEKKLGEIINAEVARRNGGAVEQPQARKEEIANIPDAARIAIEALKAEVNELKQATQSVQQEKINEFFNNAENKIRQEYPDFTDDDVRSIFALWHEDKSRDFDYMGAAQRKAEAYEKYYSKKYEKEIEKVKQKPRKPITNRGGVPSQVKDFSNLTREEEIESVMGILNENEEFG